MPEAACGDRECGRQLDHRPSTNRIPASACSQSAPERPTLPLPAPHTYNPRFRGRRDTIRGRRPTLTDVLAYARDVLSMEAQAIRNLVPTLGKPFERAVALAARMPGNDRGFRGRQVRD